MPLTPEDVQNKRFTTTRLKAGYDEDEVDGFLDEVEAEMRRLLAENTSLRSAAAATASAPPIAAPPPAPAPAAVVRTEDPNETALRTLTLAQRTAEEAIAQARAEADQLVSAAQVHASSIERDAKAEHAAKISEFERARVMIETQLGELRGFERDHLTRVRAYLESQLKELAILESAASPLQNTAPKTSPVAASSAAPSVPVSAAGHGGASVPSVSAGPSTPVSAPPVSAPPVSGVSTPGSSPASATPPSVAPGASGGPGGPFSTAPLPASPHDSPELFTAPTAPASTATAPASTARAPGSTATPPESTAPHATPSVAPPAQTDGVNTDVDADSDVPSGPPSQADEGETDESGH